MGIIDFLPASLTDLRHTTFGFDFSTDRFPGIALEVEGLIAVTVGILFTEREWTEAQLRKRNYWVIVIGNLAIEPIARVFPDPIRAFEARCQVVRSASTVWTAQASVV